MLYPSTIPQCLCYYLLPRLSIPRGVNALAFDVEVGEARFLAHHNQAPLDEFEDGEEAHDDISSLAVREFAEADFKLFCDAFFETLHHVFKRDDFSNGDLYARKDFFREIHQHG